MEAPIVFGGILLLIGFLLWLLNRTLTQIGQEWSLRHHQSRFPDSPIGYETRQEVFGKKRKKG